MSLVGVAEIAEMLGVSKQVVGNWRNRKGGFPTPMATLKSGPVWAQEVVVEWAREQGIEARIDEEADQRTTSHDRRATVVSFMNMKGGVGKSTLAANIGWFAAYRRNLKVLLVDLDPQFNLSQYILGVQEYEALVDRRQPTVEALFAPLTGDDPVPIAALIQPIREWDDGSRLDLVPASLDLAWSMRLALEKAHVLRDELETVRAQYDLVIIDCAPTESILSTAAYYAADWIVVPVRPEFLATIGLPLLIKSMREFENTHQAEHPPVIAGILFNGVSERAEHGRARNDVRQTAQRYDIPVFENEISHSDSYPSGARQGKPIFMTDNARGARKDELERVADEFLRKVGM